MKSSALDRGASMGFFKRLNTVIKSNLNSLLDQAEDPDKMIGQTVTDMEQASREARQDMVKALGTAKRLRKEADEVEETARTWEDKAVLALQNGDEELAREALRRKAKAEKETQSIRARAAREEANVEGMKSTLENVEEKIEDLKARKHSLASDVRRAREAPSTGPASSGRFGSKAFDDLDRMAGHIDQMEAEAEVADVLNDDRGGDIDARFRALENNAADHDVDDALAALKSKLDS